MYMKNFLLVVTPIAAVFFIGWSSYTFELGPFNTDAHGVLLKKSVDAKPTDNTHMYSEGVVLGVGSPGGTTTTSKKISVTPGVERWYTNPELNFSFKLPDGFSAPDIRTDQAGVHGVLVRNNEGQILTVYAYPVAAGTVLSAKSVYEYFPKARPVSVMGKDISVFVSGFEFEIDDARWGGEGIAFLTIYNGYRFEIATSLVNQEMFNFIINSWRFAPPTPSDPQ